MWNDDITFCPDETCEMTNCFRNQKNIVDHRIPHSYFVEVPDGCPKLATKARYKIKPEYIALWGDDATEDTVITEGDLMMIARGWEINPEDVKYQLIRIE